MKQHPQPPRWASRFLHWFCKPEELDILEGDLLELFDKRLEQGKQHARLHYVRDVFSLFRPFAIKNLHLPLVYLDMFQHNVKISFRNILRNRTHSLINLAGLSVGMVCATILFMKVNYELSFDNFQQDSDRIFRILVKNDLQGLTNSGVPHPLGEAIRTDYPNFERVTMVEGMYDVLVEIVDQPGQRFLEEKGIAYVEPDYFRMFSFNWKEGNPDNVIDQPYTAVISESLAKKYFGKQDPMGQLLRLDNRFEVKINGIIEDQPQNTELPSGLLVTYHLGKEHQRDVQDNWGSVSSSVQCFVKLPVGLSHESIEGESPEFLAKYKDLDEGETERMILMPLREIHFFTEGDHWGTAPMEKSSLWALGLIGLFLLIAACINFINLNTVLVFKRAKEVGLRKVLGSMPRQIVGYFLNETALITLFSLVLCIIFVSPIQEFLTYYLGDGGEIDFANPSLWLFWGAA
ncbi:MAG: ABC transporter permease, partial [Bacteroidota bacterium]